MEWKNTAQFGSRAMWRSLFGLTPVWPVHRPAECRQQGSTVCAVACALQLVVNALHYLLTNYIIKCTWAGFLHYRSMRAHYKANLIDISPLHWQVRSKPAPKSTGIFEVGCRITTLIGTFGNINSERGNYSYKYEKYSNK